MPYPPRRFVYIIRSVSDPDRRYVGVTADPRARLSGHNAGGNRSTARWRPWFIDVCVEFRTEAVAMRFERFLKSGSGRAFAVRHFSPSLPRRADSPLEDLASSRGVSGRSHRA